VYITTPLLSITKTLLLLPEATLFNIKVSFTVVSPSIKILLLIVIPLIGSQASIFVT
jgi:hypothetical protein